MSKKEGYIDTAIIGALMGGALGYYKKYNLPKSIGIGLLAGGILGYLLIKK